MRALASDDTQVRSVEFFLDGVRAAVDGSYPFAHSFVTPLLTVQESFRLSARAMDTGGNMTATPEVVVRLEADRTPLRPDLTVAVAKSALVGVEAENVPDGAIVELSVVSENGPFQRLEGTLDSALMAHIPVPLPQGLSRFCVVARWDPSAP